MSPRHLSKLVARACHHAAHGGRAINLKRGVGVTVQYRWCFIAWACQAFTGIGQGKQAKREETSGRVGLDDLVARKLERHCRRNQASTLSRRYWGCTVSQRLHRCLLYYAECSWGGLFQVHSAVRFQEPVGSRVWSRVRILVDCQVPSRVLGDGL